MRLSEHDALPHSSTPGPVLPALPALCLALAWLMGHTTRESIPFFALNTLTLAKPGQGKREGRNEWA